jgi:hypothetical protein
MVSGTLRLMKPATLPEFEAGGACSGAEGETGAAFVLIASTNWLLPPGPIAIHVHVDGFPTHPTLATSDTLPFIGRGALTTKPVPIEEQTRVTEVAFVLFHVSV